MQCRIVNIEERLGKFFVIRAKSKPNLILEIKDSQNQPSTPVVLGELDDVNKAVDHQLWFVDRSTSTMRSKLNSYCIVLNANEDLNVQPFIGEKTPQWVIKEDGTINEKEFDNVITIRNDILVAGTACHAMAYEGFAGQHWSLGYLPANYFFIRHCETDKVLDIRGDFSNVGAQVITYAAKDPPSDNQLWYEDQNGVIHSKMNDFILNVIDMDVLMYPYNSENCKQEWVINGRILQDRLQPSRVLEVRPVKFQAFNVVVAGEFNSQNSQHWSFEDVPTNPYIYDHDGKGKYFLIHHSYFDVNLTVDVKSPPCNVFLSKTLLQPNGLFSDIQMFFIDQVHGVIRNKINERLCLEVQDSNLILNSYQSNHHPQQLQFRDGKLFQKDDETTILTLGLSGEPCDSTSMQCYFVEDIDSHHQKWILRHATAKSFFIEAKVGGKVLEARREVGQPTCNVTLGERKPNTRSAHQLWYEDENGILRSKLNGFVLDLFYGKLHIDRYNAINPHQGWVVSKECIRNRNSGLVLDIYALKKWTGSSIGASESKSTDSQKWTFLFV